MNYDVGITRTDPENFQRGLFLCLQYLFSSRKKICITARIIILAMVGNSNNESFING